MRLNYIHQNPLQDMLVEKTEEYLFSSTTYESTVNGKTKVNTLVSVGPDSGIEVYDAAGNKLSISQVYKNSIKGADTDWATYFEKKVHRQQG